MRHRLTRVLLAALVLAACSEKSVVNPPSEPVQEVDAQFSTVVTVPYVSEIHYDNASTDAGEQLEVTGPAGMDLTGWKVVLYNGSNGASYATKTLSGILPETCDGLGVVVVTHSGIQNGNPDGWALVDPADNVVEFKSYGGTFTATNGVAVGLGSADIGVQQSGSTPVGSSLWRTVAGVWTETDGTNTFGFCNPEGGEEPEVGPVATVTLTPESAVLLAGGASVQFSAAAEDAEGRAVLDATFEWASSDPSVATVDATGLVTGVTAGDVQITATSENDVVGTAEVTVVVPDPDVEGDVVISEFHYDNDGGDVDELVEIEGPAGMDVTGWQIVLYNGSNNQTYSPTRTFSGVIPDLCDGRGVMVVTYSNNLQNGSPDAIALVNASGAVVEFISYEGTITAANGPAAGMTSVDVGASESGSTPIGSSLQRDGDSWYGPARATAGGCNTPAGPESAIVVNEVMTSPNAAAGGDGWGEWLEVHNTGAMAVDLQGWTIASGGDTDHVVAASVIVPAGGFAVLGNGWDPVRNGGITPDYNYFVPGSTIDLATNDWLELRDGAGTVMDVVSWNSSSAVRGSSRALRNAAENNSNAAGSNWGFSTTTFGDGDYGTPGAANGTLSDTPLEIPNRVTFVGRDFNDPLPIGFEFQLSPRLLDGDGNRLTTTFTWVSETPELASVDADGVVRGLGTGTAVLRATAADGTTGRWRQPVFVATASTTAQYDGNTEFGEPADGDASDDLIVRRDGYTASWSSTRGTSNWVSYNLEASHFGPPGVRCDCFTYDPEVPGPAYTTALYTNSSDHHGYDIARGHLARSADRAAGTLDNAETFYFTNIIPQAANQNGGPWAAFEMHLADLAATGEHEVYIVTGVAGSLGTLKDQGTVVIPADTWKVAVIMPRDHGLEHIDDVSDLEVLAVIMPNLPTSTGGWEGYAATVDEVEALSGYDVLALLPDHIEIAVESNTVAPVAAHDGPYTSLQGVGISMSAAASTDADGDALTYEWAFGDGASASGTSVSHTYADAGTFQVRLIVTDTRMLADTVFTTATVGSRAEAAQALAGMVDQLVADGVLSNGNGNALSARLNAAAASFTRGNITPALNQLNAFLNQVNAFEQSGILTSAQADALRQAAQHIIDSV